jgi:hypothetical protein
MSMHPLYLIQDARYKHLLENITKCGTTAERGSCFPPTVGSVTPNGFITSHPRGRPRCFETQSLTSRLSEVKDEFYSPSSLLMTHYIFLSSSSSPSAIFLSPPPPHTAFLAFSSKVVCGANSPTVVRFEGFYRWAVHPHPLINS